MRSLSKNWIRKLVALGALLSLPLALDACHLVLGQGGLRLDGLENGPVDPSPTPSATTGQGAGAGTQQLAHPAASPAPVCTPRLTVAAIDPSDATLQAISGDVASIENSHPGEIELRHRIVDYATRTFGLSHADLRTFAEGLLAKSASQPVSPAPAPSASPSAAAAPSPLHPTILALVVHQRAAQFAMGSRDLGMSPALAKNFADAVLAATVVTPPEDLAAYVRFYRFAVDAHGLGLSSTQAQSLTTRVFALAGGPLAALTYIDVFGREQDYGSPAGEASSTAALSICLPPETPPVTPSQSPSPLPARR